MRKAMISIAVSAVAAAGIAAMLQLPKLNFQKIFPGQHMAQLPPAMLSRLDLETC